jgi:hypothetical protein
MLFVGAANSNNRTQFLFVGFTNTFYGSTLPYGYGKIIQNEGIALTTVALPYSSSQYILNMLKHSEMEQLATQKAYVFIESDAILAHYSSASALDDAIATTIPYPNSIIFQIESILALLKSKGIEINLCALLFSGENSEVSPLEQHFKQWRVLLRRVAKDYEANYFDFFVIFGKYAEVANIDDLDHSVLTHDGNVLNPQGHLLVANELLMTMGIHSKQGDVQNALRDAILRASHYEDMMKMKAKYNH